MTAQSIVCGTCSASVPYGRLSCQSCGELLASVAGARRTPTSVASSTGAALPDALYNVDSAPTVGVVDGPLAAEGGARDPDAELPWVSDVDSRPLELDRRGNGLHDQDDDGALGGLLRSDDEDEPDVATSSSTEGHAWAIKGASLTGPSTPVYMPRPNYVRAAAEAAAANAAAAPAPHAPPGPPGAYVPPLPAATIPAGPPAPARAWAGYPSGTDPDASAASGASIAKDPAMDASRLAEFVGSVSVAGAALAAVGFLLPWASVMIGSSGTGYFDRWGLAGPAHLVVVVGILALLALSIVRNPVPSWIRTGIGGLGLGALLLGLTWPYLLGPLDAAPGVLIDAIGAIALIGSAILAIVTDRHAEADQPV
jgi:hypothetical protein